MADMTPEVRAALSTAAEIADYWSGSAGDAIYAYLNGASVEDVTVNKD